MARDAHEGAAPSELSAACIDEQTALDLASGWLSDRDADGIRAHIALCPACFDLVAAALAQNSSAAVDAPSSSSTDPEPSSLEPGTVVAGYVIQAKIGEGSAGCVYRAEHARSATPVAVKVYKPDVATATRRTPQLEAGVARAVDNRHVCRVLDVVERDGGGLLVLILELAAHSLRWELQHEWARASLGQRIECGLAVSRGLAALHAGRFIHRDLKPENVLRMPDGRLVLSDFGLATRPMEPADAARTIGVGTARYMAPEQRNSGATSASDIYALGLVLHEIVFGVLPLYDESTQARAVGAAGAITRTERQLRELCANCLAIEPSKRPRSASAVVASLERLERSARGERQLRGSHAVAVLGVASTVAAAIWFRSLDHEPTDAPQDVARGSVTTAPDRQATGTSPAPPSAVRAIASSEQWQALVPRTGEFYIDLSAPIPRGVTTCPSSALRSRIPRLPEVAKEAGLVGTLWQGNQGLCLELNARGVLLVYWGHRADDITEGTWMSSGRYVDLAVKRRDDPTSPEFHWTAEVDGRTMLARPAGSDSRIPIVLAKTSFADRKPTGCSSVDLTYISADATSDRAGSPFNANYIKLRIAEQINLSACYRQYRTAVAPHDVASWLLRHGDTGRITGVALTNVANQSVPVRWFSDDATSACTDDGTAIVRSDAPGYCENTLEGCVARALRLLRLGPTTLDTDPGDNASHFWYYGGATDVSLYGRTCRD